MRGLAANTHVTSQKSRQSATRKAHSTDPQSIYAQLATPCTVPLAVAAVGTRCDPNILVVAEGAGVAGENARCHAAILGCCGQSVTSRAGPAKCLQFVKFASMAAEVLHEVTRHDATAPKKNHICPSLLTSYHSQSTSHCDSIQFVAGEPYSHFWGLQVERFEFDLDEDYREFQERWRCAPVSSVKGPAR
jgi:hypothetical protein